MHKQTTLFKAMERQSKDAIDTAFANCWMELADEMAGGLRVNFCYDSIQVWMTGINDPILTKPLYDLIVEDIANTDEPELCDYMAEEFDRISKMIRRKAKKLRK